MREYLSGSKLSSSSIDDNHLPFSQTNLEQLSEVTVGLLGHKTPIVRQCTQQFLTKCFAMATAATLPKKVFKIYLSALIKVMSIFREGENCYCFLEYRRSRSYCAR